MPLEQTGPPSSAAPRQSNLNAWMRLQSHRPAHTPVPIPVPGQVRLPAVPSMSSSQSKANYSNNDNDYDDDDQDEVSQQLLNQPQRPPSSILPPSHHRRNGGSAGSSRRSSPALKGARQSPRPHGSVSLSSSHTQSRPSRTMRHPGTTNSSAMEIDELANTDDEEGDEGEESDAPPLIISDLDPRYAKKMAAATTPKKSPPHPPPSKPQPQPPSQSSLSIRQQKQHKPHTPHKTNGASKASTATSTMTTPMRQPVISIPVAASASSTQRTQPHTPGRAPMTMSVSLPSLYTPRGADSKTGMATAMETDDAPLTKPKTKSPIVAVGRRSNTGGGVLKLELDPSVRVKGRPKGWKPGMTYREAALINAGVDPNDPNVPPEILIPPRARKTGRPPGRPRLPGPRPKLTSSQGNLGYKRIGRPPIQPVEVVQRSIFCSEQACFAPFMCEWTGCRAELHNMATLRRHVQVVHGKQKDKSKEGGLVCQWRSCCVRREEKGLPPTSYKSTTDRDADGRTLMEHVEYQHLTPLEWHRGDGFANHGDTGPPKPPVAGTLLHRRAPNVEAPPAPLFPEKPYTALEISGIPPADLPRYLLDDEGKQVTPLLRDGLIESSAIFWSDEERGRRLKELYRQYQQNMNRRPERGLARMF